MTIPAARLRVPRVHGEGSGRLDTRRSLDKDAQGVSLHFNYRNEDPRTETIAPIYDGVATTKTANPLKGVMRCLGGEQRALGMIAFDPESDSEIGYYELDAQLNLVRKEDSSSRAFVVKPPLRRTFMKWMPRR